SVTSRSAGLSTLDPSHLGTTTQFLMSILMFIGASPSSVGGGIRTTTSVVIILTLVTYMKGRQEVRAFNRTIPQEDIMKSFVVFTLAAMAAVLSIIVVNGIEHE